MSLTEQSSHLCSGALLIAPGTILPEDWKLDTASSSKGWSRVTNVFEPFQLEKQLFAGGWTLFFIAGAVTTIGFGFSRSGRIYAALTRLVTAAGRQKCNCLEIDEVGSRSFLGIPYVSISAHPRHIQKGMVFAG
jgi:hypothetical protein